MAAICAFSASSSRCGSYQRKETFGRARHWRMFEGGVGSLTNCARLRARRTRPLVADGGEVAGREVVKVRVQIASFIVAFVDVGPEQLRSPLMVEQKGGMRPCRR